MEVWKPIEGCDGYEVSNLGRVRSFKQRFKRRITPRILKPHLFYYSQYLCFTLTDCGNSKDFMVHRLVAEAFIPNPENKPCVNHINGIKTDNRAENLEWVTYSENNHHAVKTGLILQGAERFDAKLTVEQVIFIRNNSDDLKQCQLAQIFGVSQGTISGIQRGKSYKNAGGYIREKKPPGKSRIPDEIRAQIRAEYKRGVRNCGCKSLAKKYGVNPQTVRNILSKI